MNRSYLKVIAGVLLVFILGFVAGGLTLHVIRARAVTKVLTGGPETMSAFLEKRMTQHMSLDASLHDSIRGFLLENLQQRRLLQKQIQPQVIALNEQTRQQIEGVLKPEQVETFHSNVEQVHRRFGQGVFRSPDTTPAAH